MTKAEKPSVNGLSEAPMLGDHLAMDLLNTEAIVDGQSVDYWHSGEDVRKWLARHGIAPMDGDGPVDPDALLARARTLRSLVRRLIEQRKQETLGDIAALDAYLRAYVSAPHLARDSEGGLTLTRQARAEPVASMLGPLAEATAQLLVDGDFDLVKQCQHPECVLWFYDRTKAHKRRWCSMALCGNRHKAAQFRKKAAM
ncbi:putative RNA-binding Zn ribbon-like protein [Duganella sp. 1411]|uniref:CGNR zinc finger domain-containing protein n=1 Tax=Duganella sp. 1411 TaxID=2806572 RepID=UPI001AE238B7|nr:ABATE domain-containing protein [Duganella sp. 1411]MBP1207241.1 putative RNA-binding Zn ribbon-like protein [Duganella sp. 1411]